MNLQLEGTFNEMDIGHKGYLTLTDLLKSASPFVINPLLLIRVFNDMDTDNDGIVDYPSYAYYCLQRS